MLKLFKQKMTPVGVAEKLVAGTDPADLLKLCRGHFAASDLERLFGELLTLQVFLVDYNLWFGIKNAEMRAKVLDAYYPQVVAAAGLAPDFYRTDAFVERMRAYGSAMKSDDRAKNFNATALHYFSLKATGPEALAELQTGLLAYVKISSKTIQSALKKVLILEQRHAH